MKRHFNLIKNWRPVTVYSSTYHLEGFLVASITTVLAIRLFLHLTGYPEVSGSGLHIAHMLWGGLLMLLALVVQSAFLGDRPRAVAAVLGGIGFGFFVDEIGKFLTKNNDYFFQPAALIIYVVFLGLWFLFRELEQRRSTSRKAFVANILELLQEGLLFGFNQNEVHQLQRYLALLDRSDPSTQHLFALSQHINALAKRDQPSFYIRFTTWVGNFYTGLVKLNFFGPLLYTAFFIQAALSLYTLADFAGDWLGGGNPFDVANELHRSQLGQLAGGLLYSIFVIVGFIRLRHSRLWAYQTFKTALLINIFITQFFAFYRLQFAAAAGLMFNLLLFSLVNYAIRLEKHYFGDARR